MNETYLAVAGRIRRELQELTRVVERTLDVWRQAKRGTDDYYVDATALNLHGFYAGIERVLELIADAIDHTKPTSANWHQELLRQMAAGVPSIRPAVLDVKTRDRLDKYRGFRHVIRNVYTFNLDPDQIELLIRQLQPTMNAVSEELAAFAEFLEQVNGVRGPDIDRQEEDRRWS